MGTIMEERTERGSTMARAAEQTIGRIAESARVGAVFGQPIEKGEVTVIPCAEVFAGAGMGGGSGSGTAPAQGKAAEETQVQRGEGEGFGGGSGARARPIAAIVIARGTVHVEPIVDATRIALAALTTAAFMGFWIARLTRAAEPGMGRRGVRMSRPPALARMARPPALARMARPPSFARLARALQR
jgi:uncharacterized spore protein YtfJ